LLVGDWVEVRRLKQISTGEGAFMSIIYHSSPHGGRKTLSQSDGDRNTANVLGSIDHAYDQVVYGLLRAGDRHDGGDPISSPPERVSGRSTMRPLFAVSLGLLAMASCDVAMAAKRPVKLAPKPLPAAAADPWNGFYVGVNGGGSLSQNHT